MTKIKLIVNGVIVDVDKEEVSKGIETGELKIESKDLINKTSEDNVIYSKDEFEIFKTNLANEEYKKGKSKGNEMLIKDAREKYELDFEGKTIDNFADALKAKVITESKIEPNKKIQELEDDKKKLQQNYTNLEAEFTTFKTSITEKETRQKKDTALLGFIPDTGLKVNKNITLLALKNQAGIDIGFSEDGKAIPLINGQVKKNDKTLEPESIDIVVKEALKTLDLIKSVEGGSGEGDSDNESGKITEWDKFEAEMTKKGIVNGSEAFNIEMNKRIKDGTLKI